MDPCCFAPPELPSSVTDPAQPVLSVVIPTLNEAQALPALLADLGRQQGLALEILVGDGGSSDGTIEIATAAGARCIASARGRGAQMNAAARHVTGAHLLFLHADSRLDDPALLATALATLRQAERQQPRVAGHFRLRFLRSTGLSSLAYRYLEEKTGLNRPHTTNGDQGLLLSRAFFDRLGGFDDRLPFLEDQRLADKIRALGQWLTLPGVLATSARRFESEGFHRRYLLMGIMMGMYAIDELEFFSRAPGVYRVQEATGRLLLAPIFGLLWTLVARDWGVTGTIRTFYRLGQYLRQNAWQPFFFLDVWLRPLLGSGRYPFLGVHDRVVGPCLDFRLVDGLAGLGCFCWYLGVLAAWFGTTEWLARRIGKARLGHD